jgi:anti-sigma factor RsiW
VRCSSCEPLLDRYVEGTLSPRRMIDVAQHLRTCESCRELIEELKVVDALLFTTTVPELPENFTFAVMAETNSMPAPRARQHPVWSFLVLYSAAAWVAAAMAMAFTGTSPRSVLALMWSALSRAGSAAGTAAASAAHGLSGTTPTLAAFGAGVLVLDAAVACAVAIVYFVVRPRLAARLASAPEVLS